MTAVPIILSTATYNAIDIIDAALFNHASGMKGLTVDVYTAEAQEGAGFTAKGVDDGILFVHGPVDLDAARVRRFEPEGDRRALDLRRNHVDGFSNICHLLRPQEGGAEEANNRKTSFTH